MFSLEEPSRTGAKQRSNPIIYFCETFGEDKNIVSSRGVKGYIEFDK
jgi:hypothetical protein